MKTYLCGHTNAGNIAVMQADWTKGPDVDCNGALVKYVLVVKTGEWIKWATFPNHVPTVQINSDNAYAAAELFAREKFDTGLGEEKGWTLQRAQDQQRHHILAQRMEERFTAEANALTIGQLKAQLTPKQFGNILNAARRNNRYARYADYFLASALGDKLRAAFNAKTQRRKGWVGRVSPCAPPPWKWQPGYADYRLLMDFCGKDFCTATELVKTRLGRFWVQLAIRRKKVALRKQATLAKRRAPMERLALHIARMMFRHKPGFGQRGDGIVYGTGHGNSGTKRRGGPGTRCAAGVTCAKGKLTFHPTHNGKVFSIPAPPLALRKAAKPGIAHPHGLFCRASTEFPGVDENWDYQPSTLNYQLVGFSIRGVAITERIARRDFTLADALAEPNQEVRRIMLELLPPDAAIGVLKLIHSDDFGSLYCESDSVWRSSNTLAFVKVVNSTPEPDGSFKDYFLRVPGAMQRAKQAVAWTFGLTEETYQPIAQS